MVAARVWRQSPISVQRRPSSARSLQINRSGWHATICRANRIIFMQEPRGVSGLVTGWRAYRGRLEPPRNTPSHHTLSIRIVNRFLPGIPWNVDPGVHCGFQQVGQKQATISQDWRDHRWLSLRYRAGATAHAGGLARQLPREGKWLWRCRHWLMKMRARGNRLCN